MKPVFKCDYCNEMGDEETIKQHEEECVYNPKNKKCFSCKFGHIYAYGVGCRKNQGIIVEPSPRECTCDDYITGIPIKIIPV